MKKITPIEIYTFLEKQTNLAQKIINSLEEQQKDMLFKIQLLQEKQETTPHPLHNSANPSPQLISNWASFMSRLSLGINQLKEKEAELSKKIQEQTNNTTHLSEYKLIFDDLFKKHTDETNPEIDSQITVQYQTLRKKLGVPD